MFSRVCACILPASCPDKEELSLLIYAAYCIRRCQHMAYSQLRKSRQALRQLQNDGQLLAALEETYLHVAVRRGKWAWVAHLLLLQDNEALLRFRCSNGFSVLHVAAAKGHVHTVELLLEHVRKCLIPQISELGHLSQHNMPPFQKSWGL
jgi:hypothetical protein